MMTRNAKRQRKRRITLPGGKTVDQPSSQGRRTDLEKVEDARKPTLDARLARGGVMTAAEIVFAAKALDSALLAATPDERKSKVKALAQKVSDLRKKKVGNDMFETDVGYCANYLLSPKGAEAVIATFNHLRACHRNYMAYFIGQTGNPKCATITMIPEPMETDPSLRVDLRSHDEKVSAAKASWAAWERRMNALPAPQMKWALGGALRGFMGEGTLWRDAKPTRTGKTVVAALQAMAG